MPSREEEVAWAAGLFEGEGAVTQVGRQFTVALVNTDEEVIRHFDEVLNLGQLYGPYENSMNDGYKRKPFFRWIASDYNALDAMQLLAPWLSKRRLERAFELTGIRFPRRRLPIWGERPSDERQHRPENSALSQTKLCVLPRNVP